MHEPQPGFQPQAFLTCLVEQAPAATQVCTSASETALQMQMYTVGLGCSDDNCRVFSRGKPRLNR
ncbi:hypothetical protein A5780_02725 [Nocardia sp. 852002-20019_SCH5090214]|nr:hypothetical protein A5780_02725 [Nocardia sp. 852002-20019_SCH5090214]OBA55553.1 hypothetical protein A5789_20335 [Nocardia sp. 852002-51101_SCH5132738]OBB40108.1 hypothetical protein A5748_33445 [Nocardia sp. 852002-51244_SCH5132740]OBF87574.1 hypothetical protein A9X06_00245 [Mycobacterium sp. 852002-51759_SCH5129042]